MLKIADYLKILTTEEVADFVIINFGEYFKCTGEALHSNLCEEQNLRKVPESFYTFLTTPHEVGKYVELIEKTSEAKIMNQSSSSDGCVHRYNIKIVHLFVPKLQLINTKPVIKNK